MNNLSIREFSEVCASLSPTKFLFVSENQKWNDLVDTIKVELTFEIILISVYTNAICFKCSDGKMTLQRVKRIKMRKRKSYLGTIFTVVCGDFSNDLNDVLYTIIAQ